MRLVGICLLVVLSCAPCLLGQDFVTGDQHERHSGRKLWWISIAAVGAATLLDATTSVGKYEQNPIFRTGDGTFNTGRGVAIKLGALGASAAAQYLLFRNERHIPTALTLTNFAVSGVLGGIAIRNHGIPKAVVSAAPMAVAQ